jgi:hypothetical protein
MARLEISFIKLLRHFPAELTSDIYKTDTTEATVTTFRTT